MAVDGGFPWHMHSKGKEYLESSEKTSGLAHAKVGGPRLADITNISPPSSPPQSGKRTATLPKHRTPLATQVSARSEIYNETRERMNKSNAVRLPVRTIPG